jgi:regulator of ribonuclease activity B
LEHPSSARAISPPQNFSPDRIDSLSKISGSDSAERSAMSDEEQAIRKQDEQAIAELAQAGADMDAPHAIDHYLYIPDRELAAKVAEELKQHGFRVEQRPGAAGTNWLVLASHTQLLTEPFLRSTRRLMEVIAKFGFGDYDGWEADVRPLKNHTRPN